MQHHELEAKVHDVIRRVKAHQPIEDDLIELKREWPDVRKAARRIAAHANAAGGAPIPWIIGIDEGEHCVVPATENEMSEWWGQVQAIFENNFAPSMVSHLNVPIDDGSVVALRFETDRAPYVITTSGTGNVEREVPWRNGTATRSAKRAELLRILVPIARLPVIELLEASFEYTRGPQNCGLKLTLTLYVTPSTREDITVPQHLVECVMEEPIGPLKTISFETFKGGNSTSRGSQVTFHGPDRFVITASGSRTECEMPGPGELSGSCAIGVAGCGDRAVRLDFTFPSRNIIDPTRPTSAATWRYKKS